MLDNDPSLVLCFLNLLPVDNFKLISHISLNDSRIIINRGALDDDDSSHRSIDIINCTLFYSSHSKKYLYK